MAVFFIGHLFFILFSQLIIPSRYLFLLVFRLYPAGLRLLWYRLLFRQPDGRECDLLKICEKGGGPSSVLDSPGRDPESGIIHTQIPGKNKKNGGGNPGPDFGG